MGYTDLDTLAINTIRILAVCLIFLCYCRQILRGPLEGRFPTNASKISGIAMDTPQSDRD
jgi:hypothetical protein